MAGARNRHYFVRTLTNSMTFDEPVRGSNGGGGTVTGWNEGVVSAYAAIRWLRGSEAVIAARLQGKQPIVAYIRANTQTRLITTSWRMRDVKSGAVYNIRAIVPSDDRYWLEITAESGVAT